MLLMLLLALPLSVYLWYLIIRILRKLGNKH